MARQPTARQFNEQRQVLDARETNDLVRQQRLFRLFQALRAGKQPLAEQIVDQGMALDECLLQDGRRGSVPGANVFVDAVPPSDPVLPAEVTLLSWAASEGRLEDIAWLITVGADLHMRLIGGRDAAWVAMERGQVEATELLLNMGAFPDLRLHEGSRLTRLMAAARCRQVDVVAYLLSTKRVVVDQYDESGRTALHHSLSQQPYTQEDMEISRLLLAAGADAYFTDNDGINPVDHAVQEAQLALMNELGVDLSMQNPVPTSEPQMSPEPAPSGPSQAGPGPSRPAAPGRRPR